MVGDTAAAGTELRTRARAADRRHVRRIADPKAVARADRRSLRRWRHGNPFDFFPRVRFGAVLLRRRGSPRPGTELGRGLPPGGVRDGTRRADSSAVRTVSATDENASEPPGAAGLPPERDDIV